MHKANFSSVVASAVFAAGVAFGSTGVSSEMSASVESIKSVQAEVLSRAALRGGKNYGLFIGINKYTNPGCGTLYGCVNDAYNLRDTWVDAELGRGEPENAYILTDSGASLSSIRAKFNSLASSAVSGDTVLYTHSSHGGLYNEATKGACLCAYDADYNDTDFADDLAKFKSGVKVIIVLDTCHSGGMFKDSGAWRFAERVQAMVEERVARAGNGERAVASIGWITAADWNETSSDGGWYSSPYGHTGRGGTFTVAFLDGWTKGYADSNGDESINFYELYQYARDNCYSSTAQYLNASVLQSVIARGKPGSGTYLTVDGKDSDVKWTYKSGAALNDSFSLGSDGSWTIAVNEYWIQNLTPSSGTGDATIHFSLAANTQTGQRTGTIVITTGFVTRTITLVQPPPPSVDIVFDGNGGKPAKQTIRQIFGGQWNTAALQQPTRSGYEFYGWWTDKTGGTEVDVYSGYSSFSENTTLYARWIKQYKVTVKNGTIYAVTGSNDNIDLVDVGTSHLFYNGDLFVVYPDTHQGFAFSHWSYTPNKADLGPAYVPRDKMSIVVMPEANITLTANYLSKPGYLTVQAVPNNPTRNDISEVTLDDLQSLLEWSVDGKIWSAMEWGRIFAVNTGKTTVSYRSKDPRWTLPGSYSCTVERDKCIDLFPIATRVSVVVPEVRFKDSEAQGTISMTPASGQVLSGKPVTLTAKPGKDSVFAYWLTDDGIFYNTTLKMAPDVDTKVQAVFKLKSSVSSPRILAENVAWSQNSMVGVAFEMSVGVPLDARPAKFSASGLPSGLKIDSQSGVISGIPTKAGAFNATVTVAGGVNSSAKHTVSIRIDVSPLPTWAQGTFSGMVYNEYFDDEAGDWYMEGGTYGGGSFTVSKVGKVSGKVAQYGTNSTFTAVSYDASSYTDGDESEWQLLIHCDVKTGNNVRDTWLAVQKEDPPDPALANAYSFGYELGEDGRSFMFWRNPWQDKSTAAAASWAIADVEGTYTMTLMADDDYGYGWLSVSIPSSGTMKATGKLADGTAISLSSPILYDASLGGYFALIYSAPSAYKGGSVLLMPVFALSGEVVDLGLSQWTSANPTATGEYGAGFFRNPSFIGNWYTQRLTLSQMGYGALRFKTDWPALFDNSFKYTYYNNYGNKTTTTLPLWWDPADTSGQSGNNVYVNLSGTGFITDQATKPVQRNKEWLYLGGNDAALTLSFAPATGVFKGTYTFWYDYYKSLDETTGTVGAPVHTSKKISFEGVLVPGYNLGGFFLWDDTAFYKDPKTGKEKSYKFKQSFRVRLDDL